MIVTIDSVIAMPGGFEVYATFQEGDVILKKMNTFSGTTKEGVEQWLANEAQSLSQSMKTVNDLNAMKAEDKQYTFEEKTGLVKTASLKAEG